MPRGQFSDGGPMVQSGDFPFILVTTPAAKLDPAARRRLRSHVMRGKNKKKVKMSGSSVLGSWINDQQHDSLGLSRVASSPIFPRVGTVMSHIPFVEDMNPNKWELIYKWLTVIKESVYPVEVCVQPSEGQWIEYLAYDRAYFHIILSSTQGFLDFAREAKFGTKAIQHLNKALHLLRENLAVTEYATSDSTISTVLTLTWFSGMLDNNSDAAQKHMKGLYHLVSLRGGIQALRHNLELQCKILRADLAVAVSTGCKPLFFREGVSWRPYLVSHAQVPATPISESQLARQQSAFSSKKTPGTLSETIGLLLPAKDDDDENSADSRLLNVALDLREFCLAANLAYQTGRKISANLYRETLVSVQYRLLALQDEARSDEDKGVPITEAAARVDALEKESSEEPSKESKTIERDAAVKSRHIFATAPTGPETLLRLGMLAFTTAIFLLIKQMPVRYQDLAQRVRHCVYGLVEAPLKKENVEIGKLTLWFLFVAKTSVLGGSEDEVLLTRAASRVIDDLKLDKARWADIREVLKEYMWIDWVYTKEGMAFWERLSVAR